MSLKEKIENYPVSFFALMLGIVGFTLVIQKMTDPEVLGLQRNIQCCPDLIRYTVIFYGINVYYKIIVVSRKSCRRL